MTTITISDGEDISAAINTATAGDTIILEDGAYSAFTVSKSIIVQAENPGGATITGPGVNQGSAVRIESGVNNVTIDGLDIDAAANDLAGLYIVGNSTGIQVQNSDIDGGSTGHALSSGGGLTDSTFDNNTFSSTATSALVYVNGEVSNPGTVSAA